MRKVSWMPLTLLFVFAAALAHGATYNGMAIAKIWARDGQVIVLFDCEASLDFNVCAGMRATYSQTPDYKGMLAVLLSAQAQGKNVTVHTSEGGTSLRALIDGSVPDYWARPMALVAIEAF